MNYNYLIMYYDVNEKRVQKVHNICKKYLQHCQNSVFRGQITPSLFIQLKEELKPVIKEEDEIVFIRTINEKSFEEEVLSYSKDNEPNNFL